ncbi:MAG: transcriptional regulator [Alphaproteobacteria bacterium]|nr:MAG: transcriptional regulator [Alphaproteobacteria bacterium]
MVIAFGPFVLDTAQAELRRDGHRVPIEPQVFALLALLVDNRDRLVTRDEIIDSVWHGRFVSDAAVASRVKSARQAIGDTGTAQAAIRTVHGRGFRFVADVAASPAIAVLPRREAARPSIAVLPFDRIGDPGALPAIAMALPHDLIAELSRLRWLFVISRTSSFRCAGCGPAEVGARLGVGYCLSGSVELVGNRLSVTVELADTATENLVWADRLTGRADDIHQIRQQLAAAVAAALEIRIPFHEASQARLAVSADLDAWGAYHRGLQHMYRFTAADNAAAATLFAHAVARDPGFARAHAGLSFVHFQSAFLHDSADLAGDIRHARRHAEAGVGLDPLDPFVNFAMGRCFWLQGDLDSSLGWLERATTISPNYAQGLYARAWTDTLSGRGGAGREQVDLAMRLSPLDPLHYAMLATRALSHIVDGEPLAAAPWAERAAVAPGAHVFIALIAVIAHTLAGNDARAAGWAANVRRRHGPLTADAFFESFPMRSAAVRADIGNALARHGF